MAAAEHTKSDPGYVRGPAGVLEDFRLRTPPQWAVFIGIIAVVASWIPLALVYRARYTTNTEPRIHFFQDMDNQPKFRPQDENPLFADGRAMRPQLVGTVARGKLNADDHLYHGFRLGGVGADGKPTVEFFNSYPAAVKDLMKDPAAAEAFIRRGQNRFSIYCAACHGQDGQGNGPIHARAAQLQKNNVPGISWNQPSNLTDAARRAREDGHIFNTITNGIRTMGGYGGQLSVEDRWAVVAYVRALQLSQAANAKEPGVIPAEKQGELR